MRKTVPGDKQAAEQIYRDTGSARLYVQQNEDSISSITVSGKHWLPGLQSDSIHVLLDGKPLSVQGINVDDKGSFSFVLPHFSHIMFHTLQVVQFKSDSEMVTAGVEFNILPIEREGEDH